MSARKRGHKAQGVLFALAAAGFIGGDLVLAQGPKKVPPLPAPAQAPQTPAQPEEVAKPVLTAIPVNPSDPIAIVNGEVITRQRLSDECVARKGEEILETMIARTLIEQAMRSKKLDVTAAEIDEEIDNIAGKLGGGMGREAWLRTLDKERGISPVQYARDIIYPSLALRKLTAPFVQVTDEDLNMAFQAQYGDKIRVRLIMTDALNKAQAIWEEVHKNPGGFERVAQERSMDTGSRSLGGLLAEPISRHAYPRTVSDAAFRQLVDGDPDDKLGAKPKDGAITGPIQVAEATWVILKREEVIPAMKLVTLKDEKVRKQTYEMIYEVKLKEKMNEVFTGLMQNAKIDNKLSGRIKDGNEQNVYAKYQDKDVRLMSNPPSTRSQAPNASATPGAAAPRSRPAPVGAPVDDIPNRPLKPSTGTRVSTPAATAPATATAPGTAVSK